MLTSDLYDCVLIYYVRRVEINFVWILLFFRVSPARMTRYRECREMVELVLRMDPDMPSAQTLHKAVKEAAERRSELVGIESL